MNRGSRLWEERWLGDLTLDPAQMDGLHGGGEWRNLSRPLTLPASCLVLRAARPCFGSNPLTGTVAEDAAHYVDLSLLFGYC